MSSDIRNTAKPHIAEAATIQNDARTEMLKEIRSGGLPTRKRLATIVRDLTFKAADMTASRNVISAALQLMLEMEEYPTMSSSGVRRVWCLRARTEAGDLIPANIPDSSNGQMSNRERGRGNGHPAPVTHYNPEIWECHPDGTMHRKRPSWWARTFGRWS